jgi:polyhydroxyalkanoate synthesis regulator phasin
MSNEKLNQSFAMGDNMMEKFWDMWLVSLGSMSWSQEQLENMVQKYLEQRKIAREESTKIVEELMGQVKKNQSQMQTMMQEAVKAAFENMDFANFDFMGVSKKVDELSKKVDNL